MDWLTQVVIRYMTHADLPALEWDGEYTHFRRVYVNAYRQTTLGRALLWVVELPGANIVGQLFSQLISERTELADGSSRAYIYSVRIRPPYRNHGIGTCLMEIAENDLQERGFQWATLNVARTNERAQKLYERLGYKVIAPEPGRWSYLDDKGIRQYVEEPAWRMEKYIGKD